MLHDWVVFPFPASGIHWSKSGLPGRAEITDRTDQGWYPALNGEKGYSVDVKHGNYWDGDSRSAPMEPSSCKALREGRW